MVTNWFLAGSLMSQLKKKVSLREKTWWRVKMVRNKWKLWSKLYQLKYPHDFIKKELKAAATFFCLFCLFLTFTMTFIQYRTFIYIHLPWGYKWGCRVGIRTRTCRWGTTVHQASSSGLCFIVYIEPCSKVGHLGSLMLTFNMFCSLSDSRGPLMTPPATPPWVGGPAASPSSSSSSSSARDRHNKHSTATPPASKKLSTSQG